MISEIYLKMIPVNNSKTFISDKILGIYEDFVERGENSIISSLWVR